MEFEVAEATNPDQILARVVSLAAHAVMVEFVMQLGTNAQLTQLTGLPEVLEMELRQ